MNTQPRNILLIVLYFSFYTLTAQTPFTKGVNLTGWFSAGSALSVPFTKFTKKDFEEIKSLGCDVVRLPITLHYMTNGAPDYTIDPIFFNYLDQVVDWSEELKMNLIIDNHTIEVAKSKTVEAPLLKIWTQMAKHYKNRSTAIFYEILNEPNTLLASDWALIQAKVVDSIRVYDTKHTIVVTGADWGGISGLTNLKKLNDPNLLYSFHFYDPFLFTHQGASWTSPSMADLKDVPYPYDAARMPDCPVSLKGTWVEGSLKSSYKTDGTEAKLKSTIDIVLNYAKTNGVNIFCGEMGVYNLNSQPSDRINWYKEVSSYLSSKSIPWTMWDYQGSFGLFKKGSNELFEFDINRPMAEGMGFTLPPVKEFVLKADTVPFDIYTDFPGNGIVQGGIPGNGIADIFSAEGKEGLYGIYIADIAQYQALDFDFKYNKDLSKLVAANYEIDFWYKADTPGSNLVFRFLDTKTTDPADHPWRKDYTVSAQSDGNWHQMKILLKSFRDAGSWDGSWFNSTNSFDWKAVDRFQIVAENSSLAGKKFWFDQIKINGTPITSTGEKRIDNEFGVNVYPNPFAGITTIAYNLPERSFVDVSIFNLSGQKLQVLTHGVESAGLHQVNWSPENLPKGIYLSKISASGKTKIVKLILN